MILVDWYRKAQKIIHTTFDGINEYITMGNVAALQPILANPFSYSFYIKPASTGNRRGIFGKATATVGIQVELGPANNVNVIMQLNEGLNQLIVCRAIPELTIGVLYHVVITYEGDANANTMKFFLNNVLVSKGIEKNGLTLAMDITTSADFNIGTVPFTNWLPAQVDKFTIFNKSLSAGEVNTIYIFGRKPGLTGVGGEVLHIDMDTLNPIDIAGGIICTSVNMDSSNIVVE